MTLRRLTGMLAFIVCIALTSRARAGEVVAVAVNASIGVRTATSTLTQYDANVRQFQLIGAGASDSVRLDSSNDGTNWQTLTTFNGPQTVPLKTTDRAKYYSTVRLAGSSTMRVFVSMGYDAQSTGLRVIRVPQAAISATSATCFPMWGSTGSVTDVASIFYTPAADVAASASDYVTAVIKVYDSGGVFYANLLTWAMGFTGNAITGHALNEASFAEAAVLNFYTVCVQFTVTGSGALPVGVWEFVTL